MQTSFDKHACGYTLLELLIVVALIGILATLAIPSFQASAIKAREVALRHNLFTMRTLLDQHYADTRSYPQSLEGLVETGYLRQIPVDPFTKSADTWQLIFENDLEADVQSGIFDIHSGSDLVASNGTPYNQW
ncbi:MAG: prepilin-type N-terminal cleavage/methylation domain-containing protein [Nitrospirales bacterium]|nr:prepilin-type N-terminal cleavage/methylation domain-containing protein [Nitrospirales bacterium]NKB82770.1 prepilin-type N-terminal cleavage/methylation domain-containing protein [Nitrospirales bacterium]